jgi:hypothetical protein
MAKTHYTPHHKVEPEGRKWNVYTRPVGSFLGTFDRLCDAMDAVEVQEKAKPRAPVDETPCAACECPLDAHRYEDGSPRDCSICGCTALIASK